MSFKHVLIATDFSDHARKALDYFLKTLTDVTSKVSIVAVASDWQVPLPLYEYIPDPKQIEEYRRTVVESSEKKIADLVGVLKTKGVSATSRVLLSEKSVAHELVDFAKLNGCDLILIGSHGAGAVSSLFLGSVAQRTIKLAHCPVLVVPKGV